MLNIRFLTISLIWITLASASAAQTKLPKMVNPAKVDSSKDKEEECEVEPNLPGVQCFAKSRKAQDRRLNAAYKAALAVLPQNDPTDSRRNKAQLVKAERAWLKFREEHCPVVGAQEGGSNMSITFNSQLCESNLTDERIKFLKSVAENK